MTGYSLKEISARLNTGQIPQVTAGKPIYTQEELIGAIGNINSPLLDMPLKNSLAMKSGVGSATFTRASTATYIDRYGVLKTAAIDEPRFEKEGYLNEGASTNLLTYSELFSNSSWIKASATLTEGQADPYGTTLAFLYDETIAVATSYLYKAISLTAGTTYTASLFVKKGTAQEVSIWFNAAFTTPSASVQIRFNFDTKSISFTSGLISSSFEELANGWFRLKFTFLVNVTTTSSGFVTSAYPDINATGNTVYIFGAQLEALSFATSYIPTGASTVTRSADVLSVTQKNNLPLTNTTQPELSLLYDFDSLGLTANSTQVQISCGVDTTNYFYTRRYTTTTQVGLTSEYTNLTGYGSVYGQSNTLSKRRIAHSFKLGKNSIYEDGVFLTQQTQSTINLTGDLLSSPIYIGNFLNTYYWHFGHITNVRIYDKALSSAEVALA